jgi:hypothetical protein
MIMVAETRNRNVCAEAQEGTRRRIGLILHGVPIPERPGARARGGME